MVHKEIFVSIRFTKNLGNYQSFVAEAGTTVTLEPGESAEDIYPKVWAEVKGQVTTQINNLKGVK